MPSSLQRKRLLIIHFAFWLVYLSFFFYQISHFRHNREFDWSRASLVGGSQLVFTMLIAYLNYFFFLPRFLEHKKVWKYLAEVLIPFLIIITVRVHLQRYLVDGYTHQRQYFYSTFFIVEVGVITLFISGFIGLIRIASDWYQLAERQRETENRRLSAELNFLKAQINPHFLFNTLNNLYYLAYSKSDNTTEVIAKLSQMMRYMIYDSNHPKVPLSKEIEYMQNYISLERLRLNNQTPIDMNISGSVDSVTIAPLILITFLENAFKHGVSNSYPASYVKVSLSVSGKQCEYVVENSKIKGAKPEAEEKSGIGLQNVGRRLELSYPGKHNLVAEDHTDYYRVRLTIDLS